jgi:beta-glucanase (GH16 family)
VVSIQRDTVRFVSWSGKGRGVAHTAKAVSTSSNTSEFDAPCLIAALDGWVRWLRDIQSSRHRFHRMNPACLIRFRLRPAFWVACLFVVAGLEGSPQQTASRPSAQNAGWILTWSDEFNGANGSSPDSTKWVVESGGNGWGNDELEYYTARPQNVRQENGNLVIEAVKGRFSGADGVQRDYTSARLKSEGLFRQRYGRFEARIQIPAGKGLWPAFWMLGDDYSTVGWPNCGEMDIMENVGSEAALIHASLHGPGYSDLPALTTAYKLPRGRFGDAFYVFAIEWEPQVVRFYVDDHLYATKTPADLPAGSRWVYDHPFFVILNLAVGGDWPGSPDDSTVFPQRMLVDYVRVYRRR